MTNTNKSTHLHIHAQVVDEVDVNGLSHLYTHR